MKKPENILRPCVSLALGFLLLVAPLNNLTTGYAPIIALTVVEMVIALGYICGGIIDFIPAIKPSPMLKKLISVCLVGLTPCLILATYIFWMVQLEGNLGITGWIIAIIAVLGAAGFTTIYALSRLLKNGKSLRPFAILAAAGFAAVLVLTLVFAIDGNTRVIGDISLFELACVLSYGIILALALTEKEPEPEPEPEEPMGEAASEEEPAEEPVPEEPAEEPAPEEPAPEEPAPEEGTE